MSSPVGLSKLVMRLPPGAPASAETLWAEPVGDLYRIKNVPIWAYGLAYDDLVSAIAGDDERLYVQEVVTPSGLLTVRVAGPQADPDEFRELVRKLQTHAVASEHCSDTYSAFAIQRNTVSEVEEMLLQAEATGAIESELAND